VRIVCEGGDAEAVAKAAQEAAAEYARKHGAVALDPGFYETDVSLFFQYFFFFVIVIIIIIDLKFFIVHRKKQTKQKTKKKKLKNNDTSVS